MITKTLRSNLRRVIKVRLRISDRQANEIIDQNWLRLPTEVTQKSVAIVDDTYREKPMLDIYTRQPDGYYTTVGGLAVDQNDLARWNQLDLEEAYGLPADFRTMADCYSWSDATLVDARARDKDAIIVTLENDAGERSEYAMLIEINDAPGTLSYARSCRGRTSRACIEAEPFGERAAKAGGLPILEILLDTSYARAA